MAAAVSAGAEDVETVTCAVGFWALDAAAVAVFGAFELAAFGFSSVAIRFSRPSWLLVS